VERSLHLHLFVVVAFVVAVAFAFLVVILTLSEAEGEEPAFRGPRRAFFARWGGSERPFLPLQET
jgi:hypothetical protein